MALDYLGCNSSSGKMFYHQPVLSKPQSCEIGIYSGVIALKFGRYLGSIAAEVPAKFQSKWSF